MTKLCGADLCYRTATDGTPLPSFYEVSITLIQKPNTDITGNYRSRSLVNIGAKILNETPETRSHNIFEELRPSGDCPRNAKDIQRKKFSQGNKGEKSHDHLSR
jgi:hypothetical protein